MSEEKKVYSIGEIIKQVATITTPDPPSITTYTSMDGYFESMTEALAIIRKYTEEQSEYSPDVIERDMIVLSALHAQMSVMVGYLQGISARTEASRKLLSAKYAVQIKNTKSDLQKSGHFIKMTDEDSKSGARILSEDESMLARDHETISRIITNAWYAIDKHVQVLRSALKRSTTEQFNPVP